MNWRTEIKVEPSPIRISMQDMIFSLGSCFAVHMDRKFRYFGFGSMTNPTGILYNPHSIVKMLKLLLGKEPFDESKFVERDGMICHYDFHNDMRAKDKESFKIFWARAQKEFDAIWAQTTVCIITLGTAHVYEKEGEIVANCHKQPAHNFQKKCLSIEAIQKDLKELRLLAEAKNLLITVSPVRHLKDGFIENQLSKAHLIAAIHGLELPYFPSYEIVLDDLRDYRFYEKDRVHPTEEAVEYVWKKFGESHFDPSTIARMEKVEKWRKLQNHRPFNPLSNENKSIKSKIQDQYAQLKAEIPHLVNQLETKGK